MNFKSEIKFLEEEVDLIIESFINRMVSRIVKAYLDNNIKIGENIIKNKINSNLSLSLYEINKNTCIKYNDFLKSLYILLDNKVKQDDLSRSEFKELISEIIKQIEKTKHPMLCKGLFDNFRESIKTMTEVYDNDSLNRALNNIFEKDTIDILNVLNEIYNEFLLNQIKCIIRAIINF